LPFFEQISSSTAKFFDREIDTITSFHKTDFWAIARWTLLHNAFKGDRRIDAESIVFRENP
jgi:hypothetical protein